MEERYADGPKMDPVARKKMWAQWVLEVADHEREK